MFKGLYKMSNVLNNKIKIYQSKTANSAMSDYANVTKEQLKASTEQHIGDVKKGIQFIINELKSAADKHDYTKIDKLDAFHKDFITEFKTTDWWEMHKKTERHHLDSNIPDDVNLVDVIEYLVDGVMAAMGRSGKYVNRTLPKGLLDKAFDNTVEMLINKIEVIK